MTRAESRNEDKSPVVAVIQARMGSTRFPGKVLADLQGRALLGYTLDRVGLAKTIDKIVVATTTNPEDDRLVRYCHEMGIGCFRGSEDDVLDRYHRAALAHGAATIVRVTADCPLLDPKVIDKVINTYLGGDFDYVSNVLRYTYPDGMDVEVFSASILSRAWEEAHRPLEREHVTPFMRNVPGVRRTNVENEVDLSSHNLRLTVDHPEDLEFVREVLEGLAVQGKAVNLDNIVAFICEGDVKRMNAEITRNQGYYLTFAEEKPVAPLSRSLTESQKLTGRAQQLIPSHSQTFSKGPTQFVRGVAPSFVQAAKDCRLWDVDGNEYIDTTMALCPVVLGYDYPAVVEAVAHQLSQGATYSIPHSLEVELADTLVDLIPSAEMVRYGKNGSDATSGAVRAARAFTGRDHIACCGYHGWQDWYIGTTTRNAGVPKAVQSLTHTFGYNDLESLRRIFQMHPGEVAAVIMEPVGVVEPQGSFLQDVADLTRSEGALLIYDEIVTGFRFSLGGAQKHFNVTPDLTCIGKAMANGLPISAVVGRRDVMELFDEIFFSFTFGGEVLSLRAAQATLQEMKVKDVIPYLWEQGKKIKDGYNVLAAHYGLGERSQCIGYPPRTVITFKDEDGNDSLLMKSYFQQECIKRGLLFSGAHNLSFSHSDQIVDSVLRIYRTSLELLKVALEKDDLEQRLEGAPLEPVFRRA